MNIEALISKAAGDAVKALYGMDATEKMLQLQKTRSEFEGNLTLVVFTGDRRVSAEQLLCRGEIQRGKGVP